MSQLSLSQTTESIARRVRETVAREPKKAIACAALLIVCAGVLLRGWTTGNATAAAGVPGSAGTGATDDSRLPRAWRDDTGAHAGRADKLDGWLSRPLQGPSRNLFEFRPENYLSARHAGEANVDAAPIAAETGRFWDRLAKSITSRADLRRQRQIRTDNVVAAAGKLKLQSTMIQGGVPRAMIDGRLLKAGDAIVCDAPNSGATATAKPTFRIVRIGRQSVVVERDGVRVELSMSGTEKLRVLTDED